MGYVIRYSTNGGGSGMTTAQTNEKAKDLLLSFFRNKKIARIEKDGLIIGEVYKSNRKWNWYIDSEA